MAKFAQLNSATDSLALASILSTLQTSWKRLLLLLVAFGMSVFDVQLLCTYQILYSPGYYRGVEHCFNKHHRQHGIKAKVGYCGGITENPLYPEVKKDITGHAEAIEITFDPTKVGYAELVEFFYKMHDPTTLNYQGPDVGSQCKSLASSYLKLSFAIV